MLHKLARIFGWTSEESEGEKMPSAPQDESNSRGDKTKFRVEHVTQTPNPDAVQFVLNESVISQGTKSFTSAEQAKGDPLGEALFNIFGIENVYLNENFATVNKSPIRGWNNMIDEIKQALETHLTHYDSGDETKISGQEQAVELDEEITEITPDTFFQLQEETKFKIIDALFEQSIRPALAADGGGLTLQGLKGNVIQIEYQGACGTCPSSRTGTLQYIETMLKENLHPDLEIQAI